MLKLFWLGPDSIKQNIEKNTYTKSAQVKLPIFFRKLQNVLLMNKKYIYV